ncbi:MAG TPA: class I SAM-dependent RNA methyltransferase [Gemmatimonadales bacterium]|nr:class I SAM-dependent RNA methyltransferase [Gemmatimonadales bacterium]
MRAEYDCYAITAPGLERVTARELGTLDLVPTEVEPGGVAFRARKAGLYTANLELRSASRVVVRLGAFHASAFHELERRARRLPWHRFLGPGATAEFRVTSRKSKLYHQDAVAERLARMVENGRERARTGENVAPQLFVIRLFRDECTISVDSSGELLHRRGYRLEGGEAPLRETLAAAMLLESGWDGRAPLADPFCGSGTIPIEAAWIARRRAPGLDRRFAFERWPEFDPLGWKRLRDDARSRMLDRALGPIVGADRDEAAVATAASNAERAGVADDVELRVATMAVFDPPAGPGHLVTNPPYGVRVGDRAKLRGLYARLGEVVRTRCAAWRVTMLSPDRSLEHATGLRFECRWLTTNGGIKVRLVSTPS